MASVVGVPVSEGQRLQHDDEASSSPFSSPPDSPNPDSAFDVPNSHPATSRLSDVGVFASPTLPHPPPTSHVFAKGKSTAAAVKRPRKKKDPNGASNADDKPKEKKPRKPREKKEKDPDAPPRKKQKATPPAETPKITTSLPAQNGGSTGISQAAAATPSGQIKMENFVTRVSTPKIENLITPMASSLPMHSNAFAKPAATPPRPISSGQNYDPIRSATIEYNQQNNISSIPPSPPPRPQNRASASPSIASLIDPPTASNTISSASAQSRITQSPVIGRSAAIVNPPPTAQPTRSTSLSVQPLNPSPPTATVMDVDPKPTPTVSSGLIKPPAKDVSTANSTSSTPAVKPTRRKESPPPLPTGSGLLSSSAFGGAPTNDAGEKVAGTNIFFSIPLKGQNNVTINFAQEVRKRFGAAALNPRLAAHKEMLARTAAAGAALEKDKKGGTDGSVDVSGEEMSLDGSDVEDSNVEMGGMGQEEQPKKKTRKKKQEEYDIADDFIDDTELAWENQAAVAKDGFFVWSGPLVQEGEKPAVERAEGTSKRGRGRGRGSRGGATGTDRASAAAKAKGTADTPARDGQPAQGPRRGVGRGAPGQPRKPRITKAEKEKRDQEAAERKAAAEKLSKAAASKTVMTPGTPVGTVASALNLGALPGAGRVTFETGLVG